jgi:hypothetical protein
VDHARVADGAAITTWVAFFFSHVAQYNALLQFFALIIAIISGLYAIRYHAKKLAQMP